MGRVLRIMPDGVEEEPMKSTTPAVAAMIPANHKENEPSAAVRPDHHINMITKGTVVLAGEDRATNRRRSGSRRSEAGRFIVTAT